jgi:peptide/nickel transport system permease protein
MILFLIKRLLSAAVVLFVISVFVFLIFFETPGVDPAVQIAGSAKASPEALRAIRHQYGLDRSMPVRYALFIDKLVIKRNLVSFQDQGQRVLPAIWAAAPVTFSLVLGAVVIWVLFSITLGLAAAILRGTIWDPLLMAIGLIGISLPVFWLGEVANLITQDKLHHTFLFSWVPPPGYVSLTTDPVGWFTHLLIPWITLATLYIGLYARVLRSSLLETQDEDFVRTARAKGLSRRRVLLRHVLRNSLMAYISLFGLDLGALIGGGALVVEVVFALPGIGLLTYQAIGRLDLPVIMGVVLYGAFFIVLINALVDIAYAALDPRVRAA